MKTLPPEKTKVRPEPPLDHFQKGQVSERVNRQAAVNGVVRVLIDGVPPLGEHYNRRELADHVSAFVNRLVVAGRLNRKEDSDD